MIDWKKKLRCVSSGNYMLCVFSKFQESQPAAISTKHHVAVVPHEGTSNDCHFVGGRCPQMCQSHY